ncbi:MAG: EF-hand domain-containing protein [Planctomycetaceae bacterium]|nr:EF-hand domain-containing protein [Planctomycetaceae bacterium]
MTITNATDGKTAPGVFYFDRRIVVLRKSFFCRIVLCLLAGLGSGYSGWAQDSSRAEWYFQELDRDKSGSLSEEEVGRANDRIKDRLKEAGMTLRPGLKQTDFARISEKVDELRQKERESRGDGDRGSSDRNRPKPKVKVNLDLPANYVPNDKDGDGQIGLYEWERAKFAEFRQLDRNGDGFLSPKELVAASGKTATVARPGSTTVVPAAGTPVPVVTPVVAAPAAVPVTPTVVDTPPEDEKETKVAKFMFSSVDKNKDGTISQDEWSESRGVRVKFEQANVTPPFPLNEADFVKQYKALEQKKLTST